MRIETKVLSVEKEAIGVAAQILAEGGLVAFPTDTVYGVGAHAFQPDAVERIYVAKARPRDKAIPILLAQSDNLALVAEEIGLASHATETAWRLAERFWPGGLTLVLPKKASVSDVVSAGGPTVAVRAPDHPTPLALIAALGAPLAATSANLSGHPSPVTAQEVEAELGGRIELILDGGRCLGGVPSTVLDLTTDPPAILRAGAVGVEDIKAALANTLYKEMSAHARSGSPDPRLPRAGPAKRRKATEGCTRSNASSKESAERITICYLWD